MAAGEQTAPTPTDAPQDAAQAPEIPEALTQRMDEMSRQIADLQSTGQYQGGLSQNVTQGIPEGAPSPQEPQYDPQQGFDPNDPYAQGYDPQQGFDPYAQLPPQQAQQQAMQDLQQVIAEQVRQGVDQQVTPWIRQQQAMQLEQRYPDLAKPEVAGPLLQQASEYAKQIGSPDLGMNPQFIETFYLAQQARERAAQETPADGDQGVHLEGGGAVPGGQEEKSAGDRMLEAWNIGL